MIHGQAVYVAMAWYNQVLCRCPLFAKGDVQSASLFQFAVIALS